MEISLRFRSLGYVILLLSTVVGCHKSDPAAAVVETAPVERAVKGGKEMTAAGISLTFPDGWQTVSMSQGDLEKGLSTMEKNPRGPEMVKAARAAAQSGMIKMFAFHPDDSVPGFMNNANLVVQPGVGNASLDVALDASKKQIEAIGAQATTSKVTFPAGEFGRLESHLLGPGGKPYVAIGYIQVHDGNMDVVTFSCQPDQAKDFDAQAQTIMKTFTWK